jgi:small conductance mechanosensitive channel
MKFGRRSLRFLALGFALLAGLAAGSARAQSSAPAPAPPADELSRLVDTLQDDKARAAFIAQLRALIAVERHQPAAMPATPPDLFAGAAQQFQAVGNEILAALPVIAETPQFIAWFKNQTSDETRRAFWLAIGLKLAIIFGAGLAADGLAWLALRRPLQRLNAATGATATTRLLALALDAALESVPVLLFAGVANFVMPLTQSHFVTEQVAGQIIAATLWSRLLLAVARSLLLSPNAVAQFGFSAETRAYLYIWLRRFAIWTAYGYAISVAAWWLGTPGTIDGLLERITVFVLAVLAVIFILQNRSAVAEWLRGDGGGALGWRVLRNRLADTWHVLAIVYVTGTFAVYVLHVEGGFSFILRATVLSFIVLLAAGLLVRLVRHGCAHGFAVSAELKTRFPTVEARANRYLAVVTVLGTTLVYLFAGLLLLQVWGINSFDWIALLAERKATGSVVTIVILVIGALFLWELFSTTIERYLANLDSDSRRSARTRTLLPLLHTTVLVIIITMVALTLLSELGLNIAPLLAGAGVAGIAIGFGAQTLVKDVITGFFFLLEDTFAVGDVVDVGNGHAGTIEAISIRNFRLRDLAGAAHTVPFSEVSILRNMTRDFAYVLCDAGVAYREDPDRVIAVLREIGAALAADQDWANCLLEPLEILGVEKFTDSAMVVRARIKTAPLKQWAVGREFNRRMKKAFDASGIEMPAANQTDYLAKPAAAPAVSA